MASSVLFSSTFLLCLLLLLPLWLFPSVSGSSDAPTAAQIQSGRLSLSRKIIGSPAEEEEGRRSKNRTAETKNRTAETKNKKATPVEPNKASSTTGGGDASGWLGSDTLSTSKSLKPSSNSTKPVKPKSIIKRNSTSAVVGVGDASTSSTTKTKKNLKPMEATSAAVKKNASSTTKTKVNLKPVEATSTTTTAKIEQSTAAATTIKPKQQQQEQKGMKRKERAVPKPVRIMPWLDQTEEESDLMSEFRDLPSKFQEAFLPDLEQFSTKSKAYLTQANEEFTNSFKPIVGRRYASALASLASAAFLLLPLLLVTRLFRRLRRLLSLQKILLSVEIYVATYFSLLCLTALLTGVEPLRIFHATSPTSYVCTQVLQTFGYVLYLLLQLTNLLLSFSRAGGPRPRALALLQLIVGLAVGLHYYAAVFHRAVLRQPPKSTWKIHAVYATCFLFICTLAWSERRKKAYGGGGDDCKRS